LATGVLVLPLPKEKRELRSMHRSKMMSVGQPVMLVLPPPEEKRELRSMHRSKMMSVGQLECLCCHFLKRKENICSDVNN
jgi:hypothetical protein